MSSILTFPRSRTYYLSVRPELACNKPRTANSRNIRMQLSVTYASDTITVESQLKILLLNRNLVNMDHDLSSRCEEPLVQ